VDDINRVVLISDKNHTDIPIADAAPFDQPFTFSCRSWKTTGTTVQKRFNLLWGAAVPGGMLQIPAVPTELLHDLNATKIAGIVKHGSERNGRGGGFAFDCGCGAA
jgi:hypothetical protein